MVWVEGVEFERRREEEEENGGGGGAGINSRRLLLTLPMKPTAPSGQGL